MLLVCLNLWDVDVTILKREGGVKIVPNSGLLVNTFAMGNLTSKNVDQGGREGLLILPLQVRSKYVGQSVVGVTNK